MFINTTIKDIITDFNISLEYANTFDFLFAVYAQAEEKGMGGRLAYILLRNKETNVLYDIVAGHCSCYGFEDQFEPTETSIEAILYRIVYGTLGITEESEDNFQYVLMDYVCTL